MARKPAFVKPMARKPAFISLKDYKENFEDHPKCHLINPAKFELGKESKAILDGMNTDTRARTEVNHDLFYHVWVEISILVGLGEFWTRISFATYSTHSYGFWTYEAKKAIF